MSDDQPQSQQTLEEAGDEPITEQELGQQDPSWVGFGLFRVLDTVEEYYAYDLDDVKYRLSNALRDFPELANETVTVARDDPKDDRKAGAWPWSRIIFIPDDQRISNVTLYHELGHLAIQIRAMDGQDVPVTSEEFCSIFSMARMPTARVDEDRIPYLDESEVSRGLHPKICKTALQYREKRRNYIQQCNAWLSGEWAGRETIEEVKALE